MKQVIHPFISLRKNNKTHYDYHSSTCTLASNISSPSLSLSLSLCLSSRRLIRSGTNNVKRDLTVCTLIKYDRSNTHGLSVYLLEQSNDEPCVNHCLHIQSIENETDRCSNDKNKTLVSSVDFEIFSFSSMAILRRYLSVDDSPSKKEKARNEAAEEIYFHTKRLKEND